MALQTAIVNEIIDGLTANYTKSTLLTTFYTTGVGSAINTGNIATNPQYINLVWGSAASKAAKTSNSATNGTALNFSGKGGTTALTLSILNSSNVVKANIQLPSSVAFVGKGGSYFVTEIEISMEESV